MQLTCKIGLAFLLLDFAPAHAAPAQFTVDSKQNVQRFYGVPIDLTLKGLKNLPFRMKMGEEMGEGDMYPIVWIQANDGVEVKASFGLEGDLYYLESSDPKAVGPKGIKAGSFLSDVKAAWPTKKLNYGLAEGRYATFSTGTNVMYVFDPYDLPPQAFDFSDTKIDVPNIKVKSIRMFANLSP